MRPEYLVVSGDIADTGDVDQWEIFQTEITKHVPDTKVIMSAGNHDLNLFFADNNPDQYDALEANDVSKIGHMPRLARFIYIQSEYIPRMLAAKGQAISEVMQQAPTRDNLASSDIVQEAYRNCRAMVEAPGTVRAGCEIGASWNWRGARQLYYSRLKNGFPLTFIDERTGVAFASLLSPSIDTSSPGENAVGLIDEDQTHTLAEFARALPPSIKLLVVTLHHPLFPRGPIEFGAPNVKSLFDLHGIWQEIYDSRWFSEIFLQNETKHATALVAAMRHELKKRSDLQILFMFGHRHERSLKTIAGMIFEEAPNVATSNNDDWGFWAVKAGYGHKTEIQWCHMDVESQNEVR
jgi:hypothetical protein